MYWNMENIFIYVFRTIPSDIYASYIDPTKPGGGGAYFFLFLKIA